jgi:molybdenum cofactor cytidylyltransferase
VVSRVEIDLRVASVVLAAGLSRRMGFNKLVAPVCGKPLLQHVLDLVAGVGLFSERVLVLGYMHEAVYRSIDRSILGMFRMVVNESYSEGLGSSVRRAIMEIQGGVDAIMFFNGDTPFVRRSTVLKLLDVYRSLKPLIVAPSHRGVRGTPVLLDSSLRGELLNLKGDIGARAIFHKYGDKMVVVDVEDPGVLLDIDTPEDLRKANNMCYRL